MKNMSVKTSLVVLVSVLLGLLLLSVVGTFIRLTAHQAQLDSLYTDRVSPLMQLQRVSHGYTAGVIDTAHKRRDAILTASEARDKLNQARAASQNEWKAYLATEMTDDEVTLVREATEAMKVAEPAITQLEKLVMRNDQSLLEVFTATELYPAIDPVMTALTNLSELQVREVERVNKDSAQNMVAVLVRNAVAAVLALAMGIGLSWYLIKQIDQGLNQALVAAQRVAEGDLSGQIQVSGRNEFAQLMQAMQRMNEGLVGIVSDVRQSADSIQTGATEIANGNADLSQRTEAQASNLEETAASMEELTATVKQNADTTQTAAALANTASAQANTGGEVVEQVVQVMSRITDSSRRITDIIGTIDGIAFQTNILALNAAVEAARAGEQGRGFAVVAGEVRSLAMRSADAAKEIKGLIQQSVDTIDDGNQLAARAGDGMRVIVSQVHQVSLLLGEISAAGGEQSSGIAQVGQAVSMLDQVTQQNAALVEESASAAESLRQQASHLTQLVARFRLPSPA